MPALLIFNYDVTDPAALESYRDVAAPLLHAAAERVVRTAETVSLPEAPRGGTHTVVWRFPSVAEARAFYESPAYQELVAARVAATVPRSALIVETVPD